MQILYIGHFICPHNLNSVALLLNLSVSIYEYTSVNSTCQIDQHVMIPYDIITSYIASILKYACTLYNYNAKAPVQIWSLQLSISQGLDNCSSNSGSLLA